MSASPSSAPRKRRPRIHSEEIPAPPRRENTLLSFDDHAEELDFSAEIKSAEGETSQFRIDPKLAFPVKWQAKNGGGELMNIQEGAQPASLFEVPAGFQKLDMGGITGQIPPH